MAQGGRTTKEEVTSARRAEARYTQLQPVRKDFYAATADLVRRTRADRDKAQGGDDFALSMLIANLNSIQSSATDVLKMRLSKIARMAVASAFKTDVPLDDLTAEEHEYFERVRALAKDMLNSFERECGMKTYSPQKIDVYTAPQTAPDVPVTAPSVPVTAPSSVPETAPGPSPEVPAEEMFEDPDMLDGGLMDDGDIPTISMPCPRNPSRSSRSPRTSISRSACSRTSPSSWAPTTAITPSTARMWRTSPRP